MLNALKKLAVKQDVIAAPPDTAGQPMSGLLQKKFSKGVNYNMKIIIKGDRNVGKSCLLKRLQGGGFIESYTPTEEIQVASIQWSFKATEDIVKVEVWDVVDRGKARSRHIGLKLSTGALPEAPALDAEFLDVYKGTHGVILMMDVTKAWTFDYVARELPKVPPEIPVLILGNHCDMSHHRVISTGQATALIETISENRPAEILYAESSMRNCFGLRLLHKFLGLPFLRLQKETLLGLIERNKRDVEVCAFEIAEFLKSDDSDYNKFVHNLSNKRRQIADSNSAISSSLSHTESNSSISSLKQNPMAPTINSLELRPTKSIIVGGGQPIIIPGKINVTQQIKQQQQEQNKNFDGEGKELSNLDIPQKDLVTALLQKSCDNDKNVNNNNNKQQQNKNISNNSNHYDKVISVEEFCPDEGILDRSFLEDISINTTNNPSNNIINLNNYNDSDSDENDGNPMVAKFNDEPNYDDDSNTNKLTIDDSNSVAQTKVNPLAKNQYKTSFNNVLLAATAASDERKYSISSEEILTTVTTTNTTGIDDNIKSLAPLLYDENYSWLADTTLRRSPEGGEDIASIPNSLNLDDSNTDNNHDDGNNNDKYLKRSSSSSSSTVVTSIQPETTTSNSSSKHHHKKKKDKKDKKKKKHSKQTNLDEFLNLDEEAYEPL